MTLPCSSSGWRCEQPSSAVCLARSLARNPVLRCSYRWQDHDLCARVDTFHPRYYLGQYVSPRLRVAYAMTLFHLLAVM
jgi:hypothetical protein